MDQDARRAAPAGAGGGAVPAFPAGFRPGGAPVPGSGLGGAFRAARAAGRGPARGPAGGAAGSGTAGSGAAGGAPAGGAAANGAPGGAFGPGGAFSYDKAFGRPPGPGHPHGAAGPPPAYAPGAGFGPPGSDGGPDGDAGPGAGGGVRTALAGLTTRGRSFLAAGAAAAACSYLLGQPDLLRVGLLLAALPLVCAAVLYRTRYRVAGSRRLSPSRVPAMTEARVHLRMDNVSRLPTGLLMLQDRVPYVLGPRPRFVLDRVEPGGHREVSYRVRSDLRGKYPLGPLQLRLSDPFGMCELTRSFSAYDTLTVVPAVEPLAPVRLAGESTGYGDSRSRALALAGDDDIIPRGYRYGDDLRRVHWRSTARYGELMVRREEQPQRARCTVLLDTRDGAHLGSGPDSTFEWAVSGAASVAVHMLERGYAVRLLTDTGDTVPGVDRGEGGTRHDPDTAGLLLDALAVVDYSEETGLGRAYDVLRGGADGLLVAFVGALDAEQAAVLAGMRQRSGGAVLFWLDGPAWHVPEVLQGVAPDPAAQGTGEEERMLREAGWSVLRVAPGDALPDLWRRGGAHEGPYGADGGGPVPSAGGVYR